MAIKRTLRAIRPSAAIEREYRKKLEKLIDDMQRSVVWWLRAAYRRREDEITQGAGMAQDAGPSRDIQQRLQRTMNDWLKKYDEEAKKIADWYADKNSRHVRNSTQQAINSAGLKDLITVKFKYMSRRERDVMQSLILENVRLIKTIPQQYFTEIQGAVQRCIQNGSDLGTLTDELEKRYGVTRKRAAMIARDQTGKATESLSRARMQSLGITKGIWIHTSAGKTYRQTHVAMNGKEFDLSVGLYDSAVGKYVLPGECVNCRCTYKPILTNQSGDNDDKTSQTSTTTTTSQTT